MTHNILSNLIPVSGSGIGKRITVHPRSGKSFSGKIARVNQNTGHAIIKDDAGSMRSVALHTPARVG